MTHDALTIDRALAEARERLAAAGVDDPAFEARSLLRSVLGLSQVELLSQRDAPVAQEKAAELQQAVERRAQREPLQYITGSVEFFGREFAVDRRVLIPRPETELLVEQALSFAAEHELIGPRVLDIGTGSGILAVTLAAETNGSALATDISLDALALARENAWRNGVVDRVQFEHCSLADGITERFDIVVCNPPYVLTGFLDSPDVQPELAYEPRTALDGGSDGMDIYGPLLGQLRGVMADCAAAYIEVDPPVADRCLQEAKLHLPGAEVSVLTDLAGLERCLAVEMPG